MHGQRLKQERKRLSLSQEEFAAIAGVTRRPYAEWETGKTSPNVTQLLLLSEAGADVQYIVTGLRQGHGIGDSAVHQAVLDAVDFLSLDKKVDAQQLAKAVVKFCVRSMPDVPEQGGSKISVKNNHGQVVEGGQVNTGTLVFGKTVVKKS